MSINITYDVEDMKNKTESFSEKFKAIEAIKIGDKIGIDDLGYLYIQYNGVFQGFVRWWYSQSREKLLKYMNNEFSDYSIFLDMNMAAFRTNPKNTKYKEIINLNISLVNSIIPGLDNLKDAYPQYIDLKNSIEKIVFTLIEFKTSTMEILKGLETKKMWKGKGKAKSIFKNKRD